MTLRCLLALCAVAFPVACNDAPSSRTDGTPTDPDARDGLETTADAPKINDRDTSEVEATPLDPGWTEARSKPMLRGYDDRLLVWGYFSTLSGPRLFGVETAQPDSAISHDISGQQSEVTGDLDLDLWEVSGTWKSVNLDDRSALAGGQLGGWVGRDLIRQWRWLIFDYQDPTVYGFFDGTLPTSAPGGPAHGEGWTDVPFEPDSEPPRISLTIGGVDLSLTLDTGMGPTVLSETAWELVTGGSLPERYGHLWVTHSGRDTGKLVRLPEVVVGGHRIHGAWAVVVADSHHQATTAPTGVLGWSVLGQFLVGVGLTDQALKVMRHNSPTAPEQRSFTQIGVQISWRPDLGGLAVEGVYEGTDAEAKGLNVGDVVTAFDGTSTGQWNIDTWLAAQGEAGQTHQLQWQRPMPEGGISELSSDVEVEVLLAL